jgi:hypothetical protein
MRLPSTLPPHTAECIQVFASRLRSRGLTILLLLLCLAPVQAQCPEVNDDCAGLMFPYAADGNYYRAQLFAGESAKLKLTFQQGLVYRIVPCAADNSDPLVFSIFDGKNQLVYTNEPDTPDNRAAIKDGYWDFSFGATSNYTIVAKFRKGKGCVAMLMGYQDPENDEELID